jgi:Putative peptidoglycan binding domain
MLQGMEIRSYLAAVGAVILMCAVAASGVARQAANQDTAKKPASATTSHKTVAKTQSSSAKPQSTTSRLRRSSRRKKSARLRGQQKIDSERATAIQEALIREHYLSGTASGTWDQASEDAMRRYQSDHGWQTKEVPDSRALIKLGLGPSNDHLLNPESAMTATPPRPHAQPVPATSSNPSATAAPTSAPTSNPTATPTATPTPTQADPPNPQ